MLFKLPHMRKINHIQLCIANISIMKGDFSMSSILELAQSTNLVAKLA